MEVGEGEIVRENGKKEGSTIADNFILNILLSKE